eukprot:3941876-Rhodomonas_salina.3
MEHREAAPGMSVPKIEHTNVREDEEGGRRRKAQRKQERDRGRDLKQLGDVALGLGPQAYRLSRLATISSRVHGKVAIPHSL